MLHLAKISLAIWHIAYFSNKAYVDSVSMNILQIGELAGALSGDYVERTRRAMDWRSIKGMRNIFAHDYGSMDLERTWYTAVTDVPALKEFCYGELARMDGE